MQAFTGSIVEHKHNLPMNQGEFGRDQVDTWHPINDIFTSIFNVSSSDGFYLFAVFQYPSSKASFQIQNAEKVAGVAVSYRTMGGEVFYSSYTEYKYA